MFDVNDDMDQLLRRAAENYPLKTDNFNWKKVEPDLPVTISKKRKKSTKIKGSGFLLLFLLPFAWICNNYAPKVNKEITKTSNSIEERQLSQIKIKGSKHRVDENLKTNSAKENVQSSSDEVKRKEYTRAKFKEALHVPNKTRNIKSKKIPSANSIASTSQVNGELFAKQLKEEKSKLVASFENKVNTVDTNNETSAIDSSVKAQDNIAKEQNNKIDTHVNQTLNNTTVKNDQVIDKRKTLRFYVGLIINTDLSSVKFQSTKAPGLGAGILAGYQLNKRLSIESGVYYQKKFYYTDAKYYNPVNPYTAPSYKLLSVDGNCSMLEVPINVKYNFKPSIKSTWFSVVGFSTYFMKAENYNYSYIRNGWLGTRNIKYNNHSSSWVSVINANIGYERAVTKTGILRIEPYFKLPLKELGWGRLHILSTGINVGYTRKIF